MMRKKSSKLAFLSRSQISKKIGMTLQLKETWQEAKLDAYKQLQDEIEAKRVEKKECWRF